MTGEEWYHARKYAGYGPAGTSYGAFRTAMELYPGHAAYSGIGWIPPEPEQKTELAEEGPGVFSGLSPLAGKERDLVDDLLANKVEAMQQNIERIEYQIERREKLRKENQYGLDLAMMKCQTDLFECDLWPPGGNTMIEKRRSQLERELQDLDKEKRFEEVAGWRDRQMLLKELREAITDYEAAVRRKGLLDDTGQATDTAGPR